MRIRALRSFETPHRKYVMGNIVNATNSFAERLISEGKAEKYTGDYPPIKKMKTEFFKPKENGNN